MSEPEVSVVIAALNRHDLLLDLFRGLAEQTLGRDRFEVVLIDDCSPEPLDAVADRARTELGLNIRYARTPENHGPAPARNLGASLARAPILAFTDSDCRPSPAWLAAGLKPFADPAVALVSGPCVPKPGQQIRLTTHMHFHYEEHPCFPTMNVFYRRAVFEELGGFDTSLSARDPLGRAVEAADADLAWRVIKGGYARLFLPEAVIYHEVTNLGVIGYVIEPTRHFFVPALVRRHPELRDTSLLTARVFLYPATWLVYIALIVVALAAIYQPWLLLLVPVMLIARGIVRTRSLRPKELAWWCASALVQLPRTFVMSLTLAYASVRYRALVL